MRDFRRRDEAPGRSTNSVRTITAATANTRRLKKTFTALLFSPRTSPHYSQSPPPARLVKEMYNHVCQKANAVAKRCFLVLIARCFKRPVDKHRPANDIFLRHKSPVAAVEAYLLFLRNGQGGAGG